MHTRDDILRDQSDKAYFKAQEAAQADKVGYEKVLLKHALSLRNKIEEKEENDFLFIAHVCYELAMGYVAENQNESALTNYIYTINALLLSAESFEEFDEIETDMFDNSINHYYRLKEKINPLLPDLSFFANSNDSESDDNSDMEIDADDDKIAAFTKAKK